MLRAKATRLAQELEDRLVRFGGASCRIARRLPSDSMGTPIRTQLLRCCTSPAANYAEARTSESRKDFVHKTKLCLKELRETRVWLGLIIELDLLPGEALAGTLAELDELISIFVVSVSTSKRNLSQGS